MKLNIKAFSITFGITLGLTIFGITWWIILFDGITNEPTIIAKIYRGYNISPMGSIYGLIWGLVDGAISGAIFAWLYNFLANRISKN